MDKSSLARMFRWSSIGSILVAAAILGGCRTTEVTLTFPEFPGGVAEMVLGESLIINVTVSNDGGVGVNWTCRGEACTRPNKLTSTPTSATFTTEGVTGTATITATSIKEPTITKSLTVTVDDLRTERQSVHLGPSSASKCPHSHGAGGRILSATGRNETAGNRK